MVEAREGKKRGGSTSVDVFLASTPLSDLLDCSIRRDRHGPAYLNKQSYVKQIEFEAESRRRRGQKGSLGLEMVVMVRPRARNEDTAKRGGGGAHRANCTGDTYESERERGALRPNNKTPSAAFKMSPFYTQRESSPGGMRIDARCTYKQKYTQRPGFATRP